MKDAATARVLEFKKEEKKRRARGTGAWTKRGNMLWIRYYDEAGRRREENTHSDDEKVAEKLLKDRLAARRVGVLPPPSHETVRIDALVKLEVEYLKNHHQDASWVEACWRNRLQPFFGRSKASSIRLASLTDYQNCQMNRFRAAHPDAAADELARAEGRTNKDLAVLKMCLRRGAALEKLDRVPSFPEKLRGLKERTGTITHEAFERMLAACEPEELWLKAFLIMAFSWGFRVNELLRRPVKNVDLDARTVWLPPFTTKSKRPRLIPIGEIELPLLRKLVGGKSPEQLVFTRQNGKPIRELRARWDKLVAVSGAGHFEANEKGEEVWVAAIPHDLRRSAITNFLTRGISGERIRKIVGHCSEDMTALYDRPTPETIRQLMEPHPAERPRLENGESSGKNTVYDAEVID